MPRCRDFRVCAIAPLPSTHFCLAKLALASRLGTFFLIGWTTWAVGSATCTGENCVNVVGLAPLVPIAPDIRAVVHRQWQSYGGFTFAFKVSKGEFPSVCGAFVDDQLPRFVFSPAPFGPLFRRTTLI